MGKIEMYVDSIGVSLMDYQRTLILKERGGKRALAMLVSADRAEDIKMLLQKYQVSPHLTHDFIFDIITRLEATLKYVVLDKLVQETFYAKAVLEHGSEKIEIDCRPSDAVPVALRAGAPIYVAEEVLTTAGVTIDDSKDNTNKTNGST